VLKLATVALSEGEPVLEFNPPEKPDDWGSRASFSDPSLEITDVPFGRGLEGVLAAVTSSAFDRGHAITAYVLSNKRWPPMNLSSCSSVRLQMLFLGTRRA